MAPSRLLHLALLVVPVSLSVQETAAQEPARADTTPFRGGQWAMQFGGGADLFNLGVLVFTSRRSAWLFITDFTLVRISGERTDLGGRSGADDRLTAGSVRLGRRFYQTPRGKVVSFQSLAVEGGLLNRETDLPSGAGQLVTRQWSAGLHAELGAAYRVTSSLSVGGTASVSTGYLRRELEDPVTVYEASGFYLDGIQVVFVVGVYF